MASPSPLTCAMYIAHVGGLHAEFQGGERTGLARAVGENFTRKQAILGAHALQMGLGQKEKKKVRRQ
eukprot:1150260-Pelagomonas_calceolata.AAC.3